MVARPFLWTIAGNGLCGLCQSSAFWRESADLSTGPSCSAVLTRHKMVVRVAAAPRMTVTIRDHVCGTRCRRTSVRDDRVVMHSHLFGMFAAVFNINRRVALLTRFFILVIRAPSLEVLGEEYDLVWCRIQRQRQKRQTP